MIVLMEQTDTFALPAFVISIIGLVMASIGAATGVAALVWQIVTRTRGAHRIKVGVVPNMMMIADGFNDGPFLEVQVRNVGAAPVQIRQWSVVFPDKSGMVVAVPEPLPGQPSLPTTINPGTRVSFLTRQSYLLEGLDGRDVRSTRIAVHLATGQTVRSKRGLLTPIAANQG